MTDVAQQIKETVDRSPVVVFMKGTRQSPQCGFSAQVVGILDSLLGSYTTVNVLEDPALRQGIKDYSNWPTIPQLYIHGEFVGGCDIVRQMHESGELERAIGVEVTTPTPKITVSAEARSAIQAACDSPDDCLRLEIDSAFQNALSIGPKEAGDVEVDAGGLRVVLDRKSAMRADGVEVHFVETPQGSAFRIDNPNQPPRVKAISALELKATLDAALGAGGAIELFDVRTPEEQALAQLPSARLLDDAAQEHIFSLARETPLYFLCHLGGRSQAAAEHFLSQGFTQVYNLTGGIDSWSQEVDSGIPRY